MKNLEEISKKRREDYARIRDEYQAQIKLVDQNIDNQVGDHIRTCAKEYIEYHQHPFIIEKSLIDYNFLDGRVAIWTDSNEDLYYEISFDFFENFETEVKKFKRDENLRHKQYVEAKRFVDEYENSLQKEG